MPLTDKTKKMINDISAPLAAGATVLLFVLAVMEYFRRGFVSDFLDIRIPAIAAVALSAVAAATMGEEAKSWLWEKLFVVLVLLFAIYVIIDLSLPWGRLGLAVIAGGVLVLLFVLRLLIKPNH